MSPNGEDREQDTYGEGDLIV